MSDFTVGDRVLMSGIMGASCLMGANKLPLVNHQIVRGGLTGIGVAAGFFAKEIGNNLIESVANHEQRFVLGLVSAGLASGLYYGYNKNQETDLYSPDFAKLHPSDDLNHSHQYSAALVGGFCGTLGFFGVNPLNTDVPAALFSSVKRLITQVPYAEQALTMLAKQPVLFAVGAYKTYSAFKNASGIFSFVQNLGTAAMDTAVCAYALPTVAKMGAETLVNTYGLQQYSTLIAVGSQVACQIGYGKAKAALTFGYHYFTQKSVTPAPVCSPVIEKLPIAAAHQIMLDDLKSVLAQRGLRH
jgi:hypothetical protein